VGVDGAETVSEPKKPVRVYRDVTVTVDDLDIWGPMALFNVIHQALGRPDVTEVTASLTIHYSNLDEREYRRLTALGDTLWTSLLLDVTKERVKGGEEPVT
jgi:hypothetical protein